MPLKKGEFVELDYTGSCEGHVYDTTKPDVAKKNNLPGEPHSVVICLGEGMILAGIDEELIGKEAGKHSFTITADKAFGKKDPKLIQMIPAAKFQEQKIEPQVGLQLNIDGMIGVVRTVSGGRILVDFNHPLASKDVSYEVEVKRVVTDGKEKVEALNKALGLEATVTKKEKGYDIQPKQAMPQEISDQLTKKYKDIANETVTFVPPPK
ncbi:hypothetical protein CMO91_05705 [Candidatus Woesearchaeota archaeon]|mgnify:CR=1 FL=1|nr:hypothetical protein [Candidatus Woesearchaeota archaeon]|tara:strand:+ start:675 stop:1301 length:627 start_codon:yes stop_codon:yes gene_type:complete